LVIGLDACDHDLATAWARAGTMPNLAALLDRGSHVRWQNSYGLFIGATWPTIMTALEPGRHNYASRFGLEPGTYQVRAKSPADVRGRFFWETLEDAGKRVAIVDVPHSRLGVNHGMQLAEYGVHDVYASPHSAPPDLVDELIERHGPHPLTGAHLPPEQMLCPCDFVHKADRRRTPDENAAILVDLLEAARRKGAVSRDVAAREPWDLYLTIFGESHCAGHQLWSIHDAASLDHEPEVAARLGDPLQQVYAALDTEVGALLAQAGPDTHVAVLLSHGMGTHYDGTALLEPLLVRLAWHEHGASEGGRASRAAKRAWRTLPGSVQRRLMPFVASRIRRRMRTLPPVAEWGPHERGDREFFGIPNDAYYGGIRLNVAGREPRGIVDPADVDRRCAQLTKDLRAVVNVDTGLPAIRAVRRLDDAVRREGVDPLPDLIVEWDRTAPIDTVWSPKAGVVSIPYTFVRTGDHRREGMLIAAGPGIAPGTDLGMVQPVDLAPTFASWLGVDLPDVDGRPVAGLVGTPSPAGQPAS
jgi:predicted AlkP superfamily phosphohydrolase/phosphomutase